MKKPFMKSEEILEKLSNENPLQYWAERKFYGIKKEKLKDIGLKKLGNYYEDDFYANEIILEAGCNKHDNLMTQSRELYLDIAKTLADLCILYPQVLTSKKNIRFNINILEENLKTSDVARINNEQKLADWDETPEDIHHEHKENIKDLSHMVEHIKKADIIDLWYLKEIIENEKRILEEKNKKNPPLLKYMRKSDEVLAPRRSGYTLNKNEADLMQEKYWKFVSADPNTEWQEFIEQLKELKRIQDPGQRERKKIIRIEILEENMLEDIPKTEEFAIKNPRNPFIKYNDLDYSDGEVEIIDLDGDTDEGSQNRDILATPMSQRGYEFHKSRDFHDLVPKVFIQKAEDIPKKLLRRELLFFQNIVPVRLPVGHLYHNLPDHIRKNLK